jgi:dihydroxyacetone kinase-like protein
MKKISITRTASYPNAGRYGEGASVAAVCRVEVEVISRRQKTPGKVGVVAGGGSDMSLRTLGYVGHGMLDAAVAGNVFSSPSPDRIIKGIEEANGGAGVLLIIKKLFGGHLNFGMAKDPCR